MKKKVIGIILTLAMVLTMLPAMALPVLAEGVAQSTTEHDLQVWRGNDPATDGVDYEWNANELQIIKSGLTVKGKTKYETIFIGENVETITFDGLEIYATKEEVMRVPYGVWAQSESITINLLGENIIGNHVNTDPSIEDSSVIREGIRTQDVTFTGSGNLTIYAQAIGIVAEYVGRVDPIRQTESVEEIKQSLENNSTAAYKPRSITLDENFEGTLKIEQYGISRLLSTIDETVETPGPQLRPKGALSATGEINILSGTFDIVSYNGVGIITSDLEIGGDADVKVKAGTIDETIGRLMADAAVVAYGDASIKDTAKVTLLANGKHKYGIYTDGELEISSSSPISITSLNGVGAAIFGEIKISDEVKKVVIYGKDVATIESDDGEKTKYEIGALASLNTFVEEIPDKLLVRGGVVSSEDFDPDKLDGVIKEKSFDFTPVLKVKSIDNQVEPLMLKATAFTGDEENESEEPEKVMVYTCYVGNKAANALVIKAPEEPTTPTTPENPKTADTSAMILWAVAGLAALAVVVGILVSKKQRD